MLSSSDCFVNKLKAPRLFDSVSLDHEPHKPAEYFSALTAGLMIICDK